ncbi:helix-turn-helix transcriptional regulator [Streptomyces lunaelactis]|uniref:telomere-associated protein Tap n=1 Tax=Streptomyces lunaelactis TaxID=1535768 RepID=UPI0015854376|nr:helix-turn-helix transcriptional regulator [Streptomyces lunaelactis]NUK02248.1 helix-turn-helix transcriptional regulator [Streptomyces lunaelactis]NUK16112.1 helix-turn-helix transcriptional regulator [Streptomyces lunaelactis]NUK34974.1 helix-turn-helix transcriptional regulator [Streptomyces lunaelactis]NUK41712.1 helix-turn-helix transcriptional regulator [Streptomyces lunaelactis]NUK93578.1 helix-turn-helix transcriptional regulator [Streptomyces lunaelactis]
MSHEQDELFASVDALLEQVAAEDGLPEPEERKRLRKAAGLSQEQVARALDVRRESVTSWEAGRTEPRPPKRAAYIRLLDGLAARHPADRTASVTPAPAPAPASAPGPAVPAATQPPTPPQAPPPRPPAPAHRPAAKKAAAKQPVPAAAVDPRFAHGPLAVLDGDGSAYCVGGLVLDCPAKDIASLVEWTLTEAKLGAPRLHRNGKDADPLIVLTEAAAERLGLPAVLEDRRGLRLSEDHKAVRQITRAKWKLTKRGFGPWARIYRPAQAGQRQCVQFAVLPWGALDARAWGSADRLPPAELARVLGNYAARVITPRGSTAVSGLELMTALRPPTRAVKDETSGAWVSGPMPGSLTEAVDPAPPEAPDEHPVVAALHPRGHQRTAAEVLDEEAFEWIRDPQLLTDAECTRKFAVGIDVNTAFLAAANRLVVGLGAPVHVTAPVFDKALPGSWLIDLSGIEMDARLPSPFTPHGVRPEGPAWYSTPTVAYAYELIATYRLPVTIAPAEAWIRPHSGPYLDPWYKQLSEAYRATMADLGVVSGMPETDFLTAMATHKQTDPGLAAVLSAIKSTVKGGIGKLRERPQGAGYTYGERWPALERPTWRPDIRAAVVATARVNMHRKLIKTALASQSSPAPVGHLRFDDDALLAIALISDCAVFLSEDPSPYGFLPRTADDKPAPGGFRLGVSPGMVKHEGTQELLWAVQMLDEGHNPARHIKGTDAGIDGE